MENQETKFKVDYGTIKSRIIIDVCENGCIWGFAKLPGEEGDLTITNYHELIGVLETIQHSLMTKQLEENREELKKHLNSEQQHK